ncbi:hypothetical protein [Sphingobium sp.]|uniref:hypothetical protein n=1 Tax=Sphingobium sp. TaxID=1912891 RepID=UPI000C4EE9A8|nr:hypothetical protein [Sphingobium sp.]MBS89003.1 hypothetical protein [Sphingobium sp.]
MSDQQTSQIVLLLATDAMEASGEQGGRAALLLLDAALSILVTCHRSEGDRQEMAGMLAEYVSATVHAVIAEEVSK